MSLETQSTSPIDLDKLSERLPEVADRLREWVLEAKDGDIALILKALDLHIKASSKEVQIEGAIPLIEDDTGTDLVTIVQTSGCMFICDKSWGVRRQHPRHRCRPLRS